MSLKEGKVGTSGTSSSLARSLLPPNKLLLRPPSRSDFPPLDRLRPRLRRFVFSSSSIISLIEGGSMTFAVRSDSTRFSSPSDSKLYFGVACAPDEVTGLRSLRSSRFLRFSGVISRTRGPVMLVQKDAMPISTAIVLPGSDNLTKGSFDCRFALRETLDCLWRGSAQPC